ncbi:MAG: ABC transporter permease [Desulfuromonadales bacterium]|nr:ABC transporter permease [Desulfuromonadales bacterium]
MNFFGESLGTALALIINLDGEVVRTVWTSLYVSICAIVVASILGIPVGMTIGIYRFKGRRLVLTGLNTLMALPTVVIGLIVYGLISRQAPFGQFGLLFTPAAMMIGQIILATPIVAHYTVSAACGADARILPTLRTLGAGPLESAWQMLREVRFVVLAGVVAGFGRIIAEVGVAMMLGGNIRGYTRTMTTAIALETGKGEFSFALALGLVLMCVALGINLFLNLLQQR